ncbi:TAXI family TRAP transporter solute-binding subunit [Sedimenticola hydrogenitrophicus]|uniref:TAXI family TRAP transporter solute-binding subunit n=1 Tax=Sedimenticola hydrogenitrophicus TaxID=2967975 RepID=UPI0023AF0121|nr:TAXI family TRAP transporter solute-binding subunit [Sedimenticola hydrogenitrophicus]
MKTSCLNRIIVAALVAVCIIPQAYAEEYVRIGTGGTAGTYFPIGRLIADIISQPGTILATAQPSNGSLGNVIAVSNGALETGFSQADIAAWAKNGTGIFEGRPRLPDLRLIANLYPESMHIVVRKDLGIERIEQLKGKRVALDEPGSGTLINARQILAAHGLKEADIRPEYIKPNRASDRLIDGSLDAFFFTGGTPAKAIADLAASGIAISLLPIEGPAAERLMADSRFLHVDLIPADTYKGVAAIQTLAVGAQWVTSDRINAELIYQITKTLYSEAGQKALANGHPKGSFINLANAVEGATIPFHPGAERYFREAGILK